MEDEQKTPGSCDEGPQRVRCRPTSNSGNVFLSFSTGASAAERKSCGPAHRNERAPHLERKKKKEIPSKITYIYGHKQHKGIHQQQQQHRLADDALILCLIYLADVGPCFVHLFLYSL